jgi:DNA repair protein RecN (Recombination protein N)
LAALETARISVEDVGATVRDYAGGIHASPEHLAEVEDRLAVLDRLKRKYGPTLADVIEFGAEVARKLSTKWKIKTRFCARCGQNLRKAAANYLTDSSRCFEKAERSFAKTRQAGGSRNQRSGNEVHFPDRTDV